MKPDDKQRLADQWLDAAMKEYGSAEPRFGLEERVLRSLQTAPEKSSAWQGRLAWAALAAVIVIIAGVVVSSEYHSSEKIAVKPPDISVTVARVQEPLHTVRMTIPPNNVTRKFRNHSSTERVAHEWPSQFPSPEPLSRQERLLAWYVRARPQQAKETAAMLSEFNKRDMEAFARAAGESPAPDKSKQYE